jgi:hypothetical protein
MQRICSCAIALWLFAGSLIAAQADDWVKIAENNSMVLFPAKPKETRSPEGKQFLVERKGGSVAMVFAYSDIAPRLNTDNPADVDAFLGKIGDLMVARLKGSKVISTKDSKHMGKFPVRDFELEVPGLGIYRTKITVTTRQMYQVTIAGPKDYHQSDEAKKFMQSFQLEVPK